MRPRVAALCQPRYEAVIYLDEGEDAAVDNRSLGTFQTQDAAIKAVRENITDSDGDGWHMGSVYYGFFYRAVPGEAPERFEPDDRETPLLVGPDWAER